MLSNLEEFIDSLYIRVGHGKEEKESSTKESGNNSQTKEQSSIKNLLEMREDESTKGIL